MHLSTLKKHWTEYGKQDPLFAILTHESKKGGKWDVEEFFEIGRRDVTHWLGETLTIKPQLSLARALDFGSGVGRLTQALAERFESVVGVDIAPSMIEEAHKYNRHGSRCTYIVNDRPDLRCLPDAEFDFIFTLIVLQHMRPHYAKGYLREFMRVLKPGGVIVFQLPAVSLTPEDRRVDAHSGPITEPIVDMFGIPADEVIAFMEAEGGRILKIHHNAGDGAEQSHVYFVEKPASEKLP